MSDKNKTIEEHETALDEVQSRIDDLKLKASQTGSGVKDEISQTIIELEEEIDELRSRIEDIKNRNNGDGWEEAREKIGEGVDNLKKGMRQVQNHLFGE